MAADQALLDELQSILSNAATCGYSNNSRSNDVFEGYTWSLIIQAARSEGATIRYETVHEVPAVDLCFRTSPGNIFSVAHPYTHAVIRFAGQPELEAHIGIKVAGKSKLLHECDVAVLYKAEARNCRRNSFHPQSRALVIAAECKYYASTLPLDLGRSFLGLAGEISKEGRYFVSNSTSRSVATLLKHHKLDREFGVTPAKKQADDLQKSF